MYTRAELLETYKQLSQSCWQDVPGVLRIEGQQKGPALGIMAMTHGNEPAGLAAFRYLLTDHHLRKHLQQGSVYLILNNIEAGSRYFQEAETLTRTCAYRFVDQDMNRMPENFTAALKSNSYEIQRAQELLPIYKELDYVLDLHSTTAASDPMLIGLDHDDPPLSCPGISILVRNIMPHLIGKVLVKLCDNARGYVIECGSHECPQSHHIAKNAVWRMLEQLELIPSLPHHPEELDIYDIFSGLILPDDTYELTRLFSSFEHLPTGTILARGAGPDIVTTQPAYVIMPPTRLKPLHPGSEFLFLASRTD